MKDRIVKDNHPKIRIERKIYRDPIEILKKKQENPF